MAGRDLFLAGCAQNGPRTHAPLKNTGHGKEGINMDLKASASAKSFDEFRNLSQKGNAYATPLAGAALHKDLDKFRGCLIGGAVGDALGYPVEFLTESLLHERFGQAGISSYVLTDGAARISDDTQMSLFTANGLLYGTTRGCTRGIMGPYPSYLATAYKEWYKTQVSSGPVTSKFNCSWLLNVPELYADRAPGDTCMAVLREGCTGTPEDPINFSKGCGGVMRVAPIGLYFGKVHALTADMLGADAAALTHGHEMGYIPAAMLVHMIRLVSHSRDITLKDAVLDARAAMEILFSGRKHLPGFLRLIDRAVALSEKDGDDLAAIHALGRGWCGDEALAIAVYCALKYSRDFERAVTVSVNHCGDSDSTGAITGNLLGAYLGLAGIPRKYLEHLELRDVILELAEDLYHDCPIRGSGDPGDPGQVLWYKKYVSVTYGKD